MIDLMFTIKQTGQTKAGYFVFVFNHLSLVCRPSGYHCSVPKFGEVEKLVPKFIWKFLRNTPAIRGALIFFGEQEDLKTISTLEAYSEKDV